MAASTKKTTPKETVVKPAKKESVIVKVDPAKPRLTQLPKMDSGTVMLLNKQTNISRPMNKQQAEILVKRESDKYKIVG